MNGQLLSISIAASLLLLGCSTETAVLEPAPLAAVSFDQHDDQIDVKLGGEDFTTLYLSPEGPAPYFHPLRAADGTIVTRQYPMVEGVPGESSDHPHHRGLWFSHNEVNGVNFWENAEGARNRADIVLKSVGAVGGDSLSAEFEWRAPDGKTVLTESRTVRFEQDGDVRTMDFDLTLTANDESVHFTDTKEGTFAVRIADTLREQAVGGGPGRGVMVNAEGAKGEANVWGKASPWVDYSGPIGDKTYGIAIFDHPTNPKHPTYWHVRAYGLFAANIFGEHDFFSDPARDGSITLEPGKKIQFRYLVVLHSGDAEAAGVSSLYDSWAR
jgi:hypothetical protein